MMTVEAVTRAGASESLCKHHWLLDSLNKGTCKHCGEERQFQPIGFLDAGYQWNNQSMDTWMNRFRTEAAE